MKKRIAIVEDERDIAANYRDLLEKHGYQVDLYDTRPSAEEAFKQALPDLAIIDIGLGDEVEGGFELCRSVRAQSSTLPIIFLTARDSELDIVSGLRLGADDYLTKDISSSHLIARVIALFRRLDALSNSLESDQTPIQRGALKVDVDRCNLYWQESLVDLTLTEFWMVHALTKHPGHVKTRQQLMDAANTVLDDSTITSHIKRIRKKFLLLDKQFDAIKTVYGAGYRWHDESSS